jgi:LPXTG-motif cell wall-anchored protein
LERSLSGIAWVDQDKDGLIGSAEERIAGLTVKLYQINALTGIEEEARDINGDLCSQVTDSDGKYEFTKLTSGTYRVEFSDKDGEPVLMADYTVTKKDAENQEKVNSKADPILNDEGEMTSAEITGIELPDLEKMRDEKIKKYQKDYQNIGIYKIETSRSVVKVWDDNQDQDGIRPGEVKVQLYKDGKVIEEATLHEKNQWKHVFSGLEKYEKGKEIEYTVKESVVPAGYRDEVSVDDDGNFTIVNSHTVSVPQSPQDPPQGSDTSDTPKTGDDTNLGAMILVTGASLLLLLILIMKNKDTGKRVQR